MKKDRVKDEVYDIVASFLDDINIPDTAIKNITGSFNNNSCEALATLDGEILQKYFPGITSEDINEIGKDVLVNIATDTGMNVNAKLTLTGQLKQTVWPTTNSGTSVPNTLTGPPASPDIEESRLGDGAMMHGATCPKCGHSTDMTAASKSGKIKCSKCGCVFSSKAFSISTAPSTEQYTTPYESDVNVTAQQVDMQQVDVMEDPLTPLKRHLLDMGVPEDKINNVLQLVQDTNKNLNTNQNNENTTNDNSTQNMNQMKQMNQIGKSAWFDEPSQREPGGSPYPGSSTFAEAKKEKKKDKEEKKEKKEKRKPNNIEENELFEVITILDGVDILPMLEDDELIKDLLKDFPILGREDIDIDSLIMRGQVHKTPVTDSDPSAGQFEGIDDAGNISDEIPLIDEDDLDIPEEEDEEDIDEDGEEEGITEEMAAEIGEEIGIIWDEVDFTPKDFAKGIEVEFEHGSNDPETDVTNDDILATAKIAWAHLKEFADYYDRLLKMEEEAKEAIHDGLEESDEDDIEDDSPDDTVNESDSSPKGFDEGFPVSGGAYVPLCPGCKTMQPAPLSGPPKPCPLCNTPMPSLEERDPERYAEIMKYEDARGKHLRDEQYQQRGVPNKPPAIENDLNEQAGKVAQAKPRPYMLMPQERAKINEALTMTGLDGNGRFEYATSSFIDIAEVLEQYDLLADFTAQSYKIRNDQNGTVTVPIMRKLDGYAKTDEAVFINNSSLFFQWNYAEDQTDPDAAGFGDAEVLAYLG